MKAILSTTLHDDYLLNLPYAIMSWNKLGIDVKVMIAEDDAYSTVFQKYIVNFDIDFEIQTYKCSEDRKPTYSQVSRLFGAIGENNDEILITSDADMVVLSDEYFRNDTPTIVGYDLADGMIPMCYTYMTSKQWKQVMNIKNTDTLQSRLSELIDVIDCDNIRGNYWCLDQELLTKHINDSGLEFTKISRRNSGGTATRRCDRDGWNPNGDYIDAHFPRPFDLDKIMKAGFF